MLLRLHPGKSLAVKMVGVIFFFFHYYPNICILYYSFDVFAFFLGLRLFKEAKEVNPRGKKVSHCFNFNRL